MSSQAKSLGEVSAEATSRRPVRAPGIEAA
jgi:hypothetical protein